MSKVQMIGLKGSILDVVRVLERAVTYGVPPGVIKVSNDYQFVRIDIDYTKGLFSDYQNTFLSDKQYAAVWRALAPVIQTEDGSTVADHLNYVYDANGICVHVPLEDQFDEWMMRRKQLKHRRKTIRRIYNNRMISRSTR